VAGVPAALYAVQNLAALMAYQNLDALTYNVLNQTKTLSAALCCYLVMGRQQSQMQVLALLLLLGSALVMERIVTLDTLMGRTEVDLSLEAKHFSHGVAPILLASFISGLAGALSQKNLQGKGGKNPYLFSMELCAVSVIILAGSLSFSPDGDLIRENGWWSGWTPWTMIPILTNSIGGIIVGLVTKYAGSVRKGFALIFGIFISGLIQAPDTGVSKEQIIGGFLAGLSLCMHATNPVKQPKTLKQE
jgi:UDP-sugar transporter A1/2/3